MKIVAFAASSSRNSINKQLVTYAASLVPGAQVKVLDLNDYEMPIFSEDKEKELGKPEAAGRFLAEVNQADLLMISFAEHNGSYTVAYKNLFDWCSRATKKVYDGKKVVLLSSSPGPGGANSVLEAATKSMPFFGAQVLGAMSLPSFYQNFDGQNQKISNIDLDEKLKSLVKSIL